MSTSEKLVCAIGLDTVIAALIAIPIPRANDHLSDIDDLTHYELIPDDVKVIRVSPQTIKDIYCRHHKCNASPLAISYDGVIYISDTLNPSSDYYDSIIYHETIHVVQFMNLGNAHSCMEWRRREHEAYSLQYMYNSKHNYDTLEIETIIPYIDSLCKD